MTKELVCLEDITSLVKVLINKPTTTQQELSDLLNIDRSTVKRLFKRVEKLGLKIQNTGNKRRPNYDVSSDGTVDIEKLLGAMQAQAAEEFDH